MFGASCDTAEKNQQFADKLELNFPLLSDTNKSVANKYGILLRDRWSARVTIFVDKNGKIAHIEKKVDLRNAGSQIVEKLKELKIETKESD